MIAQGGITRALLPPLHRDKPRMNASVAALFRASASLRSSFFRAAASNLWVTQLAKRGKEGMPSSPLAGNAPHGKTADLVV